MANYIRKTPVKNDYPIETRLNIITGKWKTVNQ
jgi:hypothetical protein